MHKVVHALQLAHPHRLERRLDQEGLGRVLAVADVGAFNGFHADDGLEDGSAEVGAGGQADGDDGAAAADVLGEG